MENIAQQPNVLLQHIADNLEFQLDDSHKVHLLQMGHEPTDFDVFKAFALYNEASVGEKYAVWATNTKQNNHNKWRAGDWVVMSQGPKIKGTAQVSSNPTPLAEMGALVAGNVWNPKSDSSGATKSAEEWGYWVLLTNISFEERDINKYWFLHLLGRRSYNANGTYIGPRSTLETLPTTIDRVKRILDYVEI